MAGPTRLEILIDAASPVVAKLSPARRARFTDLVDQFLQDVEFRGADGFDVTSRVRVTLATYACLLLLNRQRDHFVLGMRIVISESGISSDDEMMSRYSRWGRMDIGWASIMKDDVLLIPGCCKAMHELAHRLDSRYIFREDLPASHSAECHKKWRAIMDEELDFFRTRLANGFASPLTPHAALSEADFFNCTTTAYFEQPDMLRDNFRRVHDRLAHFYEDGR
ncbi:MAG: zinc-dependent peptidase [Hyphomonas sp.]|uniref:zinc-dependent peptidase n=1 Tax=Hyphomonas sp. TaxID=87 RepID=UPI003002E6D1